MLLSSAILIAWAVRPITFDDQADMVIRKRTKPNTTQLVGSPPLKDFAKLWQIELRRPLYDPPPPPKVVKQNKKDPLKKRRRKNDADPAGMRLVGTMLESGRSIAIFTDSSGKVDLKGEGEQLDLSPGATVDRIELTQVTIFERGRATVMKLPNSRAE